jgi:myo-inositol-1(or 4)-monophosphatase
MIIYMDYRTFLVTQLNSAAEIANNYFGKISGTVKPEDTNQVLTEADIEIGELLVNAVRQTYPDHNIIDEEAGVVDNGSRYTWVIDPIDGTSNFAAGTPDYGIMIGLLEDATPIAGGIIAPVHDRLYIALKGEGATCNGEMIHVTDEIKLISTLVSFGIDGHQEDHDKTRKECEVMANVVLNVRNVRNSGSEAIDPMYVAEGRYGGRINMSSKIWDNVAPQIITEEAGAVWSDVDGNPIDYSSPLQKTDQNYTFCVAPPVLHAQLIRTLKKAL